MARKKYHIVSTAPNESIRKGVPGGLPDQSFSVVTFRAEEPPEPVPERVVVLRSIVAPGEITEAITSAQEPLSPSVKRKQELEQQPKRILPDKA